MAPWLRAWMILGVMLAIGWFSFSYEGRGHALVKTVATIIIAGTVADMTLDERRRESRLLRRAQRQDR